jgi:hypothetical protein
MSDYITNLVSKATNPAREALQPRLSSIFEPVKAQPRLQIFKQIAADESSDGESSGFMPFRGNLEEWSPEYSFDHDAGRSSVSKGPVTSPTRMQEAIEDPAERQLKAQSHRSETKPIDRSPEPAVRQAISEEPRLERADLVPVRPVKADSEQASTMRDAKKKEDCDPGILSIRDAPKIEAPKGIIRPDHIYPKRWSWIEEQQLPAVLKAALHEKPFTSKIPAEKSLASRAAERAIQSKSSDAHDVGRLPVQVSPGKQLTIVGRPPLLGDRGPKHRVSEKEKMPKLQEQVVNVTIGRIEIKASQEAPRRKQDRFKQSIMSLDEYLRRRAEGGIG